MTSQASNNQKIPRGITSALRERTVIVPFILMKTQIEGIHASDTLKTALKELCKESERIMERNPSVTDMLVKRAAIMLLQKCDIDPKEWIAEHNDGKRMREATQNLRHKCAQLLNHYRKLKRKYGHHLAEFTAGYEDSFAEKIAKRQEMLRSHGYRESVVLFASFSDTPSTDADKLERIVQSKNLENRSESEIVAELFDICLEPPME